MSAATIEKLIWTLIFGGIFVAGMGLFLSREGSALALPATVLGVLAVIAGAVLVWVRSRMKP